MLRIFKKYYPIRNIFFVIIEGMCIYFSVALALFVILGHDSFVLDFLLMLKALLITFVCQLCLYYNDLYDPKVSDNFSEMGIRLLQALGFASIFLAIIYIVFPQVTIPKGVIIISLGFVILLVVSWRFIYSMILNKGLFNQKIILIGSGKVIKEVRRTIIRRKDCGYTLALEVPECIDDVDLANPVGVPIICQNNFEGLCDMAQSLGIRKIVVDFKEKRKNLPTAELLKCRVAGIEVIDGNDFFENLTGKLTVSTLNPSWLIFSSGFRKSSLRRLMKRSSDLFFSLLLLILCFPLIIITAFLIKLDSKGSIIFSQERVGENGKLYLIHKFRSMINDAEKQSGPVWAQSDDDRVTRVGKFIRKWRIDELPQLWNVLKGDMSFVGPRPERDYFVKELQERIPYYSLRLTVKPGITGWAQICYRYGASVEDAVEKLNFDLFYIKNMSALMDFMIVLQTIKIVIFGTGSR